MASSRCRARVAISSDRRRGTRSLCALHVADNHGATRAGAHAGDATAADRTHGRTPRRNGHGAGEQEGLPKCLTKKDSFDRLSEAKSRQNHPRLNNSAVVLGHGGIILHFFFLSPWSSFLWSLSFGLAFFAITWVSAGTGLVVTFGLPGVGTVRADVSEILT